MPASDAFARLGAFHFLVVLHLQIVELLFELADDFRDLVADRRRINFDAVINRRELAQQRLGDLAVGRDDDFAGLGVHHVERNFFAEQDVAQRFRQLVVQFAELLLVIVLNLLGWRFSSLEADLVVRSPSFLDETFTSMTMP